MSTEALEAQVGVLVELLAEKPSGISLSVGEVNLIRHAILVVHSGHAGFARRDDCDLCNALRILDQSDLCNVLSTLEEM